MLLGINKMRCALEMLEKNLHRFGRLNCQAIFALECATRAAKFRRVSVRKFLSELFRRSDLTVTAFHRQCGDITQTRQRTLHFADVDADDVGGAVRRR
jgi:hypothetical protein